MKVNSRLKILVAEKELAERRRLGILKIAEESGATRSTIQGLLNNEIQRVPLEELAKLCAWGQWQVGDILRADEVAEQG
jgi:putative transcriptional regulator